MHEITRTNTNNYFVRFLVVSWIGFERVLVAATETKTMTLCTTPVIEN